MKLTKTATLNIREAVKHGLDMTDGTPVLSIHNTDEGLFINSYGRDFLVTKSVKKRLAFLQATTQMLREMGRGVPYEIWNNDNKLVSRWSPNEFPEISHEDRMKVVQAAVEVLKEHITGYSYHVQAYEGGKYALNVQYQLEDGPTARFAQLLFHGSPDAHRINGNIFLTGGLERLMAAATEPANYQIVFNEGIEVGRYALDIGKKQVYVHPDTDLRQLIETSRSNGLHIDFQLVPKDDSSEESGE